MEESIFKYLLDYGSLGITAGLLFWLFLQNSKTIKEIREHLVKLANKLGYEDCYSIKQAGYDVDHIIPKYVYDLDDESEMLKCNSIHNLRWLTSFENRSKGCKIRPQDLEIIKTLPKEIYPIGFDLNII